MCPEAASLVVGPPVTLFTSVSRFVAQDEQHYEEDQYRRESMGTLSFKDREFILEKLTQHNREAYEGALRIHCQVHSSLRYD
jgi:hypothetical protein